MFKDTLAAKYRYASSNSILTQSVVNVDSVDNPPKKPTTMRHLAVSSICPANLKTMNDTRVQAMMFATNVANGNVDESTILAIAYLVIAPSALPRATMANAMAVPVSMCQCMQGIY